MTDRSSEDWPRGLRAIGRGRASASIAALRFLDGVARTGSIGGVARASGLSQPTVSAALRRLEASSGLRLLDRSKRGSQLTDVGQVVVAWARPLLDEALSFEHAIARLSSKDGKLRIAASMTIAEHLVPRWMVGRVPGSDIELTVCNSDTVMHHVSTGSVELGFVEGMTIREGLESRIIARDSLVVVVGPRHAWASRLSAVTAPELVSAELVVREAGSGTREVLESALGQNGLELPSHLTSLGSTSAIKALVREGQTVGVVSTLAVEDDLKSGVLVAVPNRELQLDRSLRAVWAINRELPKEARNFLDGIH